jgi:hypothetical protein
MTEFYVVLQDANCTGYGCTDHNGDEMYFEDLDEARIFAKDQLDETYIKALVIDARAKRVVDFFK